MAPSFSLKSEEAQYIDQEGLQESLHHIIISGSRTE